MRAGSAAKDHECLLSVLSLSPNCLRLSPPWSERIALAIPSPSPPYRRASVSNAMFVCSVSCLVAFVFLIAALQMPTMGGFVPLFVIGFVGLFSINAVVRAAIMWSVPLSLRSMACSVDTVLIHIFGDIPSPPIVGYIEDSLVADRGPDRDNWRVAISAGVAPLMGAALLFGGAVLLGRQAERAAALLAAADDGSERTASELGLLAWPRVEDSAVHVDGHALAPLQSFAALEAEKQAGASEKTEEPQHQQQQQQQQSHAGPVVEGVHGSSSARPLI